MKSYRKLKFLSDQRSGATKGQDGISGSVQRSRTPNKEASSPTAAADLVIVGSVEGSKQERGATTRGMPNMLAQTEALQSDKRTAMNVQGELLGTLIEIDPENHQDFAIVEF